MHRWLLASRTWFFAFVLLFGAGAAAQGIDELRAATEARPTDADAWTRLGEALWVEGDAAGAREAFLEAIATDYLAGDAHFGLGLVEFDRGDHDSALFSFSEVARLFPARFDGHFNRAVALARLQRPAEAASAFEMALQEAEPEATRVDRLNAWTGLGSQRMLAGEPAGAAEAFAQALALDPRNVELAYSRGVAMIEAGLGLDALVELTDLEARTSDYRFSALIADIYLEQGQVERALRALERAERKAAEADDPAARAATLVNLGELLRGLGREPDASRAFAQAAEVDPNSWVARYSLGVAYLASGQPRAALSPLQAAAALAPDDADVALALATAHEQVGAAREALESARRALASAGSDDVALQAFMILGRSAFALADYPAASEAFAAAIERRPDDALARTWAGLSAYQRADYVAAIDQFEVAVRLDPNAVEARVNLAAAYLVAERYREAEGVYRFLVEQNPRDADSLHHLGWALYLQERDQEAIAVWSDACELGSQAACGTPR